MSRIKFHLLDFLVVLIYFGIVFSFWVLVKAHPAVKIQFTADAILSLSGISDGDLYIAQNSECDSLNVSGLTLSVDIPDVAHFRIPNTKEIFVYW